MIGGAVVLLAVASLVRRPLRIAVATVATIAISGGALGVALWQWSDVQQHGAHTYVAQAVVMDGFSVFFMILVSIAMILSALVADGYLRREGWTGAEFHVLAMVSASGAMLMAMANDLIIVFLGVYPKPVLDRINPSVNQLIAHVETTTHQYQPPVTEKGVAGVQHAEGAP